MCKTYPAPRATVGKACLPTRLSPRTSGDLPEGPLALDTEEVTCEGRFLDERGGAAWRQNLRLRRSKRVVVFAPCEAGSPCDRQHISSCFTPTYHSVGGEQVYRGPWAMSGCISAPHDRGAPGIQWVQPGLLLDTHVPRVSPLLFCLSSSVLHVPSCQRVLTVPAFPPRAPAWPWVGAEMCTWQSLRGADTPIEHIVTNVPHIIWRTQSRASGCGP